MPDARCSVRVYIMCAVAIHIATLSLSFAPNLASETETRDVCYYIHTQYAVDGRNGEMGKWEIGR